MDNKKKKDVFKKLNPKIVEVLSKSKLKEPTPIQEEAIEPILNGKNVLLISETGTGKTLAVMLPVFQLLLEKETSPIAALYITPLKSLNRNLLDRLIWWSNHLEIEIAVRHGDTSPYERKLQVEFPPQLMISTLETLQPILTGKKLRELLKNIRYVIIDECHEVADSKRGIQLVLGLERLKQLCGDFQLIMLSATVGSPEEVANFFSGGKEVEIIKTVTPKQMEIKVIGPKPTSKDSKIAKKTFTSKETAARLRTIMDLIEESRSTLTFTNTRDFAEILTSRIRAINKKFPIGIHHSSLSKTVRIKTEKDFKAEKLKSILCTSSLQLGIDIGSIDLTLQYMSPRTVTQLVQRCLPYNTKILVGDGTYRQIGEVIEKKLDVPVICYDEKTRKFLKTKIERFHKYKDRELIKVKLNCGEEFSVTPEHPILTMGGWKVARDINYNDKIGEILFPIQKAIGKNIYTIDMLDKKETYVHMVNDLFRTITDDLKKRRLTLKEFCKIHNLPLTRIIDYRRKKGRKKGIRLDIFLKVCRIAGLNQDSAANFIKVVSGSGGNKVKIPKFLNKEILWLAGIMASDGYLQKSFYKKENIQKPYYKIKLGTKSSGIGETFRKVLREFGLVNVYLGRTTSGTSELEKGSKILSHILWNIGIPYKNKTTDIEVSPTIFKLKPDLIKAFLCGVINGDGNVKVSKNHQLIRIFSASRRFIEQLHLLCARLGYHSNSRELKAKKSKLIKKIKLNKLYCLYLTRKKDVKYLLKACEEFGKRYNYNPKYLEYKLHQKYPQFSKTLHWESIKKIEKIKLKEKIPVYNLTLNSPSTLIVGNIITHNCGRSGHTLDKVSKGIIISTDEDDCFEAAVIARKALAEELEPIRFHQGSLDVLAHQLVGMTLEEWRWELPKAYQIVKRAYPYHNLTYPEFLSVCKQLQQLGLVFLDGHIKKKRRGFEYYFTRLSTIPDVRQFRIYNTLEQSFVGVLDEEFVALHGEPGTTFIVKGEPWRIIATEEDRILVEPTDDVEAAVPGWEGELIPVPFAVAQEVGRLRGLIKQKLERMDEREAAVELMQLYPVDENTARKMIDIIKKQKKFGMVPDDKTILVEDYENVVMLHACFGSLVNQTLGRFLAALLTARIGSVGLRTDPYRMMIQFQQKNVELIKEILLSTNPEHLQSYLEMALTKSELFEWKFMHVAKRFGAISRDAQLGRVRMKRIIDDYVGTPIHKETLKELETEKLDIPKAVEILRKIQSNEIKLIFKPGLSPLGKLGIKHKYAEVIGPERPEREIFELFKQRLLSTKVMLVCVNCGEWNRTFTVGKMPEDVQCSKCGARLLGIVHPTFTESLKLIKKKLKRRRMSADDKARFERVRKTADLYLVYRKPAAVALAGRGVGSHTAKRILAKLHETEDDLFKDILEAERNWVRTRRYWQA